MYYRRGEIRTLHDLLILPSEEKESLSLSETEANSVPGEGKRGKGEGSTLITWCCGY
jgi:hypothetical protein